MWKGEKFMIKKMKERLKNQKGMTLIELLAVIIILGIIAAIAVPAIGNLIDKSRYDSAKSEAIQAINATKLYVAAEGIDTTKHQAITNTQLKGFIEDTTYFGTFSVKVENGKYTFEGTVKGGSSNPAFKNSPTIKGTVQEINALKFSGGVTGDSETTE